MTATDVDMVLDGNAAAGLLSEIFALEPTTAIAECSTCGATGAVGAMPMYAAPMGAILRCAHCHSVLMSVVSTPRGRWLEMSGVRCLRF
jgi:hypothetical protein